MRISPAAMIELARKDNPTIRYALRIAPTADGGAVLGAFCRNAGGFIPVAIESPAGSGEWERMPLGYLEIDGKAIGTESHNWKE